MKTFRANVSSIISICPQCNTQLTVKHILVDCSKPAPLHRVFSLFLSPFLYSSFSLSLINHFFRFGCLLPLFISTAHFSDLLLLFSFIPLFIPIVYSLFHYIPSYNLFSFVLSMFPCIIISNLFNLSLYDKFLILE